MYPDLMKHIKFDDVTPAQKKELEETLKRRKQSLEEALQHVNDGLQKLASK